MFIVRRSSPLSQFNMDSVQFNNSVNLIQLEDTIYSVSQIHITSVNIKRLGFVLNI